MNSNPIVCLHGFGGSSSDFDFLASHPGLKIPEKEFWAPDYMKQELIKPLNIWVDEFCDLISHKFSKKVTLLGYSQGGRLGLNAIYRRPDLFSSGLLLSTSPGCFSKESQHSRQQFERTWQKHFSTWSWEQILLNWNQLPVFDETSSISLDTSISRKNYIEALSAWSPTQHLFDAEELKSISTPIQWIAGEADEKYKQLALEMGKINPLFCFEIRPRVGHRLLVDDPEAIVEKISLKRGVG